MCLNLNIKKNDNLVKLIDGILTLKYTALISINEVEGSTSEELIISFITPFV